MTSVRPQFASGPCSTHNPAVVCVPEAEYDNLVKIANQYSNLCQNLISGGVNEATIQLLSDNTTNSTAHTPQDLSVQAPDNGSHDHRNRSAAVSATPDSDNSADGRQAGVSTGTRQHGQAQYQEDWSESLSEDTSEPRSTPVNANRISIDVNQSHDNGHPRPQYERVATRSVQLTNLSEETTHADVTAAVRGGLLLDIYLRRKDGTVSLSFLNSEEAQAFYDHVRKNDLYIKNKRVEARWNDRQYILPGHLAQKIRTGATRNFVIRRCDRNITEEAVREDLEHIHNLIVVKISFLGGDCYISTNSVANAMFARTCMMSRLKYKGSRIEADVDECAQSLDRMPIHQYRRAAAPQVPAKQPLNPMANRFQLLNLDDE